MKARTAKAYVGKDVRTDVERNDTRNESLEEAERASLWRDSRRERRNVCMLKEHVKDRKREKEGATNNRKQ